MLLSCLRGATVAGCGARRSVTRWLQCVVLCAACTFLLQLLLRDKASDDGGEVVVRDARRLLPDGVRKFEPRDPGFPDGTAGKERLSFLARLQTGSSNGHRNSPASNVQAHVRSPLIDGGAGYNLFDRNPPQPAGDGQIPPVAVPALKPVIHDPSLVTAQIFRGDNIPDDMLSMTKPQYLPNFKNPCWFETDTSSGERGANMTLVGMRLRLRCLPYFHLIGVDKSGTTDLWYRLSQHPDMAQPHAVVGKETHWWSWRRFGFDLWTRSKPVLHFDWYLQRFDGPAEKILNTMKTVSSTTYHHVITGEGSPTLFWDFSGWELIPQNTGVRAEDAVVTPHCLHHLTPEVKLMVMLRHPVDRLYSEYLFLNRFRPVHNISAQLFHHQVQESAAMLMLCATVHSTYSCLLNRTLHMTIPVRLMVSMYSVWLEQWLKVFPRDQLLIIRNEDYSNNISHHLRKIMEFVGLDRLPASEVDRIAAQERAFVRTSEEKAVGDMLPETRVFLTRFYRKYNEQLAAMLSDRRFLWLDEGL